jgi:hypothetical protein
MCRYILLASTLSRGVVQQKEHLWIVRVTAAFETDQSARAKAFVQIASRFRCDRFC